jgi:cell division transport system permease protein
VNLRSVEFVIEEAITGIRRNGLMAFASISTIALSLGVLGAFVLVALGANNFSASQLNRFEIAVFVKDQGKAAVDEMAEKLRSMDSVTSVEMRDRDKEWAEFKRQHPDIESAGLPRNVLPYAMDVRVSKPQRLPMVAAKIRAMPGIDAVKEGRDTLGRVMAVARVVRALSIACVLILLTTTVFIISNAIKLTVYARRREIQIMQLVGATNHIIRMPLVVEGVVFGAIGALAAWALITGCSSYLSHVARSMSPMVGQFSSGLQGMQLATMLLVMGGAIGAAGSFVSIRRFLRD